MNGLKMQEIVVIVSAQDYGQGSLFCFVLFYLYNIFLRNNFVAIISLLWTQNSLLFRGLFSASNVLDTFK